MSTLAPFSIHAVLEKAFGEDAGIRAASVAAPGQVFLAGSDSSLKILDVSTSPSIEHAHLLSVPGTTSVLPSAAALGGGGSSSTSNPASGKTKAVNKLSVVTHIHKAVVLSETLLTFHTLPSFNPASNAAAGILGGNTSSIKGVLAFDVDYASATPDSVEIVILKRKGAALFKLTATGMDTLREVALPNQLVTAIALRDWCLCYADLQAYSLMDFRTTQETHHFLPISQDHAATSAQGDDAPAAPNPDQRPAILPVDAEFLLASHSGTSTLGVFVSAESGDPSRGTMQWPSNVRSLALQHDLVLALLLDRSIQMHRHSDQQHIVTLHLPEALAEPRSLVSSTNAALSIPVPQTTIDPVVKVAVSLCPPQADPSEPPSTPNRTPDVEAFPKQDFTRISPALASAQVETVLLTRTGLAAVQPVSLVSIVEHHLSNHKAQLALTVASADYCPNELKSYVHLRMGLGYLHQTNFDEAGPCFVMACAFGCDPRLLIRLFPDLRLSRWTHSAASAPTASTIQPTQAWVPAGAAAGLLKYSTIDALILANLTRNYSPHLNLQEDSANLTVSLQASSRQMIRLVCESVRAQNTWPRDEPEVKVAVLTALAKLRAQEGAGEESLALISEGGSAADLEEWLEDQEELPLLRKLYEHQGETRDTDRLRVWSKMVDLDDKNEDDEGTREASPDFEGIADLAAKQEDEGLRLHYAFWLVERQPNVGLRALWKDVSLDSSEKQLQVYHQLHDRNEQLATHYLDGVVLLTDDPTIQNLFVEGALKRLSRAPRRATADGDSNKDSLGVPDCILNKLEEAQEEGEQEEAEAQLLRLRFIVLLCTRASLDWTSLRSQLERIESLAFERSVAYGQLALWRQGLATLAISAEDVASAECFCVQRGVPLHPHTLRRILNRLEVDFERLTLLTTTKDHASQPPTTDELMQTLIDILLNSGHPNSTPTLSRFINAQSGHLDPLSVLGRIPEQTSLQELAPFLSRALRRSNHNKFEASIQKALAATQAMQIGQEMYQLQASVPPQVQTSGFSSPKSTPPSMSTKELEAETKSDITAAVDLTDKLKSSGADEPKVDIL